MLEKPRLADEKIIACLQSEYGLTVTELTFLPLGYDSNAGVYRVHADGQSYFLKARRGTVDSLGVLLPRYLNDQGIEQIIAPLPALDQGLWAQVDDFTLILYPFVEGHNGWSGRMSDSQWIEFGTVLKQLHSLPSPSDFTIPRETFIPPAQFPHLMRQIDTEIQQHVYENPFQRELAAFWMDHQNELIKIVVRSEQLGRRLHTKSLEFVLCHADIHVGNLLLTPDEKLFVVDWDQPILAPKERDLMFTLVGGFVTDEREEQLFLQGYGPVEIDPLVMAYYRYERTMEDLALFAEQVFLVDSSDETKQDSMKWFKTAFVPDGILAAAHQLDYVLKEL